MVTPLAAALPANGALASYGESRPQAQPSNSGSITLWQLDNGKQITTYQQAISILEQSLGVYALRMDPVEAILCTGLNTDEKMEMFRVMEPNLYGRVKTLRDSRPDIGLEDAVDFCDAPGNLYGAFAGVLEQRPDIQPADIEHMLGEISQAFTGFGQAGPILAEAAAKVASNVLIQYQEISPSQLGEMFMKIGIQADSPMEALKDIDSVATLLTSGGKLKPQLQPTEDQKKKDGSVQAQNQPHNENSAAPSPAVSATGDSGAVASAPAASASSAAAPAASAPAASSAAPAA